MHRLFLCSLALLLALSGRALAQTDQATPRGEGDLDAAKVQTRLAELRDADRDRAIPVKFYVPVFKEQETPDGPATIRAPLPLVLLSHGLGGTREVGAYLGEYWARHGYVVCAIQHPGSDDSVWRGLPLRDRMEALRRAVANPQNAIDRPRDVAFVIDALLAEHERGEGVGAMIDPDRIAAAGHSFGAYTVLAVAGQRFGPRGASLGDGRVRAVIAMSPQPPRNDPELAYGQITIPILHLTGTHDTSPIDPDGMKPEDRQRPFQGIGAPDQYLIVFTDADHMVFSGAGRTARGQRRDEALDETVQSLVQKSTLLFLDAFLKGDPAAQQKLRGSALEEMVGDAGVVEKK